LKLAPYVNRVAYQIVLPLAAGPKMGYKKLSTFGF